MVNISFGNNSVFRIGEFSQMRIPKLNKTIHEQTKLRILVYLTSSENVSNDFTKIKKDLEMTAGNLSIQLSKLENEELIKINKKLINKKSRTEVEITEKGKNALSDYLTELEKLLSAVKGE